MDLFPIRNDQDHERALARIDELMEAESGSPEGYELDAFVTLVDAYETRHFPIDLPGPVAFIKFMLEQKGLTRKDLEPMIGSRAQVSEILAGRRNLTLNMIRKLHKGLDIAPEYLMGAVSSSSKGVPLERARSARKAPAKARPAAAAF